MDGVIIDSDDEDSNGVQLQETSGLCKICGADKAAMHYGAWACVGCKGFFRRALLKADQLECIADGECVVSNLQKIQCRSCRFQKCLQGGMNPALVRPNREVPGKPRKPANIANCAFEDKGKTAKSREEWMRKMSVEMRTILMNLLNIETKIMKGDTNIHASKLYPLKDVEKLKNIIENPGILKGRRTEMRYEAYRMAGNDELCAVVYRRLIATVDWIEQLSPLLGFLSDDDKMAMVKGAFAPLMVFNFAARTAEVSNDPDVLCLCNFAYVPRNISKMYSDTYHLGNGLVERTLNELVAVYRRYGMREEEIVCVSALICLNPLAKDVSETLFDKIVELRNRVADCLFSIVKEVRSSPTPNICYGHILMSLATVSELANAMSENLQFAQTFSMQGEVPLLTDLFGCFTAEPFVKKIDEEAEMALLSLESCNSSSSLYQSQISASSNCRNTSSQTDRIPPPRVLLKRKIITDDEEEGSAPQNFRLLQPPTNFCLTEMFDDLKNNQFEQQLSDLSFDASTIPTHSNYPDNQQNFRNCAGPSSQPPVFCYPGSSQTQQSVYDYQEPNYNPQYPSNQHNYYVNQFGYNQYSS